MDMRKIVERGQLYYFKYGRIYKNNRKSSNIEHDFFDNFQTNLKFTLAIKSHLQLTSFQDYLRLMRAHWKRNLDPFSKFSAIYSLELPQSSAWNSIPTNTYSDIYIGFYFSAEHCTIHLSSFSL